MDNLGSAPLFFFIIITASHLPSIAVAQQPYVGLHTTDCYNFDNSTSSEGYFCNGLNRSCQAYLTFRAQPPYASVAAISNLLGADPSQLAQLNSVGSNHLFPTSLMVLVPVACSCSGQFYQVNATYAVQRDDTYLRIANDTFQGLSNCKALQKQNPKIPAEDLLLGERVTVPLRCACPTKNQSDDGVRYLLSYLVGPGEYVDSIGSRFGVSNERLLSANELSDGDSTIYHETTLLVPLQVPPTSSEATAPQPPPPPSVNPSPPISPPGGGGRGGSSKTWVYAVVGAVVGSVLAAIVGWVLYRCFVKRRSEKSETILPPEKFESVGKPTGTKREELLEALDTEDSSFESLSTIAQSLKVYRFEELRSATRDFDPGSLIRGSVYRGVINGDHAAIKKTNGDVSNEISLLNKINHFNLITLSGVCFEEGHWYLVYEYAPNGSLHDWIHVDEEKKKTLNWETRLKIAADVANGLAYLHCYTAPPCVHKDLNSSNVLLDQQFRAKISNFGLARLGDEGRDGNFAQTRHVVGTRGFMAPEYVENGFVSTELDVYAFGVLLLEILTGKEVSLLMEGVCGNGPLSEILEPVLCEEEEEDDDDEARESLRCLVVDSSLEGDYNNDQALQVCKVIYTCLKKNPSDRPDMDEVAKSLSTILGSSSSGVWG